MKTINYDSAGEFVRDMSDGRTAPSGVHESHDERGRWDFFWTESFADAIRLHERGWREGTAKVAKHREGFAAFIAAAKQAKSRQHSWDVTGDYVDVGRYLTGEPECWGCEVESGEQASDRVVSIRINNCVSGAVDAEVICARGLAVLVAVDLLESCGIRCEVVIGTAGSSGGRRVESNVIVKRAGEQCDPDAIAFTVAHPAFLRRFGFRFMELHGFSPNCTQPCPMSDVGQRHGTVEIDEVLSGVRLSPRVVTETVLKVAERCGLTFTGDEVAELIGAATM